MRIVFMGTPDYSVKTLRALYDAGHEVAAVFAQPDKPVGRKQIMTAPPVKLCAEELGIKVYQPQSLKGPEAAELMREIKPEIAVVVAYGKILPEEILKIPKYGCVNGHASLLPKYRGASPIQWCIVKGESKTGVTIQQMDCGIDTGDILAVRETDIGTEETAEELFERLSVITAELMTETLDKIAAGTVAPQKQDESLASYAPIIKKEMAEIRFKTMTAAEVHNATRGYYSWPCAYFMLGGKRIKLIKCSVGEACSLKPGTVAESTGALSVVCRDGITVKITELQPEGSKRMTAAQMLCGRPIAVGTETD